MPRSSATVTWPGFRPDVGLLLPLRVEQFLTGLPPSLAWQGPPLERKDECHVTVLNRACGNAARDALGDARVRRLFMDQEWILHRTGDARLLRKPGTPDAFSLIEDVDLPSLNTFRQAVSHAMSADLPAVPPHVTLYTAGKLEGIGLPDRQTLARLQIARLRLPGIANRHPPALPPAHYTVRAGSGLDIRIGEHSPTADALLVAHHARRALLLSACNPFSEASTETANQLRHSMLEMAMRSLGLTALSAEGRDPAGEWPPEASLLVVGTTPELERRLLCDYEQHAAVLLQHGRPAELLYHPDTHLQR